MLDEVQQLRDEVRHTQREMGQLAELVQVQHGETMGRMAALECQLA